jgi:hypothetical protein
MRVSFVHQPKSWTSAFRKAMSQDFDLMQEAKREGSSSSKAEKREDALVCRRAGRGLVGFGCFWKLFFIFRFAKSPFSPKPIDPQA